MNILLSIDNNYVKQLINLVFSIKIYNEEKLSIYIIYDNLTEENKDEISKFVKKNKIGSVQFIYYNNEDVNFPIHIGHTKKNTYYRLYAPFIIDKKIDRILYLDCDIICNNKISKFYNCNFYDKCIIGCLDSHISKFKDNYINAGMYLIDLKKYRELLTVEKINKVIKDNIEKLEYQVQDVLNILFKNNVLTIDTRYNYQVNVLESPKNLDYAAFYNYTTIDKPWNTGYSEPIKALPYYICLHKMGKSREVRKLAEQHYKHKLNKLFNKEKYDKTYSVDVIIPTFNQTNSIKNTLDSICMQELDGIKMTVLLIDDCSTEDYLPIVNEYKKRLNLKYYRMEKNSGVAGARQRGIDEGDGDFFTIIDSDDQYFSKYTIQFLYYAMLSSEADVVRSIFLQEGYRNVRYQLYRNDNIACHGKLYRKKFIEKNNIRYLDLRGNEDTAYNALLESLGAKYYDLDVMTYRWCFNKDSFTRKNEMYHEQDLYTFCKGFLWTSEQIQLRKDKIDKPEEKVCILLAKILKRIGDCWILDTRKQMMIFASKIYLICRKIKNMNISNFISKYVEKDEDIVKKWLLELQKNMMELEEYNQLTEKERIELGELFDKKLEINEEEKEKNLILSNNVEIKDDFNFYGNSKIIIGENTIIDKNVSIITNKVPYCHKFRNKRYTKSVIIGKNVYIGMNTIIMLGVTIGDNCYIEPGSIVSEDIDDNCVAGGNPCKTIRKISEIDNIFYDNDKYINREIIYSSEEM